MQDTHIKTITERAQPSQKVVMNKIYLIREQKVMLDRDLGELYGVKAIQLREQVERNQERFPENFILQLTEKAVEHRYRKMRYLQPPEPYRSMLIERPIINRQSLI
mgnify:CR=1 FL=1